MDTRSLPTSMEDTEEYLRSLEPPPIFIDEWAKTEHPDALTDSLLGCAFLEAADGSGSLTFHTPRYYSAKLRQALSAPEMRHLAVKHFMRAADAFQGNPDAFPGEAWVRFQIGWYSFAYEEGPGISSWPEPLWSAYWSSTLITRRRTWPWRGCYIRNSKDRKSQTHPRQHLRGTMSSDSTFVMPCTLVLGLISGKISILGD